MRLILIATCLMLIYGCEQSKESKTYHHTGVSGFGLVCLQGVQYYSKVRTHNTYFTPAFDKHTGAVILCDWDGVKVNQ